MKKVLFLLIVLLFVSPIRAQGISPAIEKITWLNNVAENWLSGNPLPRSADGWELAIHFTGTGDLYKGGLKVYVAEADANYNITGDIFETTSTDFNPFQAISGPPAIGVLEDGFVLQTTPSYPRCPNLSAPSGGPDSRRCIAFTYFDVDTVHECNWYVSFEGTAPLYYAPELFEDEGYLIWIDKPGNAQANYQNAMYVYLDTEFEPNDWDSFVKMRYSHEGFSSWYKFSNTGGNSADGITIDFLANFTPPVNTIEVYPQSPANAATVNSGIQNFSWNISTGIVSSFELLINNTLYNAGTNSAYNVNLSNGSYSWKVRAVEYGTNMAGEWSAARNLTVQSLSGAISGPSSITLPGRFDPIETGTWSAVGAGGSGGYSYTWYKIIGSSRYFIATGSSYSQTFNFGGSTATLKLEVDIKDSSNNTVTKTKNIYIYADEGGGA